MRNQCDPLILAAPSVTEQEESRLVHHRITCLCPASDEACDAAYHGRILFLFPFLIHTITMLVDSGPT